ncbi:MAG: lysozyme [Ginsengibacter sp.]
MKVSEDCIAVIKHYELYMRNPYLCPAGKPTIGYGNTRYENGQLVKLSDPPISEPDACELLHFWVEQFSKEVGDLLKVPVTQYQFDALVSFAYNVGSEALAESTLLRFINDGIINSQDNWKKIITLQFCRWIYAKGKKDADLIARRHTEALLFCDGIVKYFKA